jgi:hypothetical protein
MSSESMIVLLPTISRTASICLGLVDPLRELLTLQFAPLDVQCLKHLEPFGSARGRDDARAALTAILTAACPNDEVAPRMTSSRVPPF